MSPTAKPVIGQDLCRNISERQPQHRNSHLHSDILTVQSDEYEQNEHLHANVMCHIHFKTQI